MNKTCFWDEDVDWAMYETECGKAFTLEAGTLKEAEFKYCVFCGKEIVEKEATDELEG